MKQLCCLYGENIHHALVTRYKCLPAYLKGIFLTYLLVQPDFTLKIYKGLAGKGPSKVGLRKFNPLCLHIKLTLKSIGTFI